MMSVTGGSPSARGRGRGRGRILLPAAVVPVASSSSAEDVIDGCVVRQVPRTLEYADRYSDEIKDGKPPSDATSAEQFVNKPNSKVPEWQILLEEEGFIPVKVLSVNFEEKYVEIKFIDKNLETKCKVQLYESPLMKQWTTENPLVARNKVLMQSSLISALEMQIGGPALKARKIHTDPDGNFSVVTIDMFETRKLKNDFISSLVYMMVPRLPQANGFKIGVITNLREGGYIDVVFYDQIWLGLREAVYALQKERKLFSPRCPVIQALFKEMIESFNVQYFLAPLNGDWTELHRVRIIGLEVDNNTVKVLYVDLGKQVAIHLKNLAIPLTTTSIPDMINKIPSQAVTLNVANMDPMNFDAFKSLRMSLEGRVCYVKVVDDSETASRGTIVDIYVSNSQGAGTVSISDLVVACAGMTVPPNNTIYKLEPLNTITRKLDGMEKDWQAALAKEALSNKDARCECCEDETLGTYEGVTFPSVSRALRRGLENMCLG